jgi:hypothetical protein
MRSKVAIQLPGAPTGSLEATPKSYVDTRAVPPGGTPGQVLTKASGSDYDYGWAAPTGGSGGGATTLRALTDYTETSAPTDNQVVAWQGSSSKWHPQTLATVALTGSYNDLTNKPTLSQTVNYAQPLASEAFSATAGASNTYTLGQAASSILLVFLNGQQLQPTEYSTPSSTQVTVTPTEGALTSTDKIAIVYARSAVFSGTLGNDVEFTDAAKGVILKDRVNGNRYRLFMSNGVLGTEIV